MGIRIWYWNAGRFSLPFHRMNRGRHASPSNVCGAPPRILHNGVPNPILVTSPTRITSMILSGVLRRCQNLSTRPSLGRRFGAKTRPLSLFFCLKAFESPSLPFPAPSSPFHSTLHLVTHIPLQPSHNTHINPHLGSSALRPRPATLKIDLPSRHLDGDSSGMLHGPFRIASKL